jgi:hypothetical protein
LDPNKLITLSYRLLSRDRRLVKGDSKQDRYASHKEDRSQPKAPKTLARNAGVEKLQK